MGRVHWREGRPGRGEKGNAIHTHLILALSF